MLSLRFAAGTFICIRTKKGINPNDYGRTKIFSTPSHHSAFSPVYFIHLNITPATLAFSKAFTIYLRYFSFLFINLQSVSLQSLFLAHSEVLLLLKHERQRQSPKWGSRSFRYPGHQKCSLSIYTQMFPRDFHSVPSTTTTLHPKLYI